VAEAIVSQVEVVRRRIAALRVSVPMAAKRRAVGKVFVIAAHGIETPKLLLQSRSEKWPGGVGEFQRPVRAQPHGPPVAAQLGARAESLGAFRGPLSTAGIESPRSGDWRSDQRRFPEFSSINRGWECRWARPESTVRDLLKRGLRGRRSIARSPSEPRERSTSWRWWSSCRIRESHRPRLRSPRRARHSAPEDHVQHRRLLEEGARARAAHRRRNRTRRSR